MKLVLADSKHFRDSISISSELVNEVKFKATTDGLEMVAMDPANVAMVILKILSSCFIEYKVEGSEEVTISLTNLKQILRRVKSDDVLSLETTEDSKLKVQLKGKTTRSFSLPLLELDDREQRVPELTFPITIEMPSSLLTESIEDVSVVAESVTLLGDKDELLVKAQGDLSKAFIEIKNDEITIIKTDSEDKFKGKYSLEYLRKMMSGSKISDKVHVSFNTDYPLKIEYKVIDRVAMSFILAPRVDND
jgi:proliferating cell nuclear antigen